jgi:hypothetical protein
MSTELNPIEASVKSKEISVTRFWGGTPKLQLTQRADKGFTSDMFQAISVDKVQALELATVLMAFVGEQVLEDERLREEGEQIIAEACENAEAGRLAQLEQE